MSEYYDYEKEERVQVSLAESTLEEQMLGLARSVDDSIKELRQILEGLSKGDVDLVKSRYEKVRGAKNMAERVKDDALRYMAGLGVMLYNSDVYRSVFLELARVAMNIDGVAHRALLLAENGNINSIPVELWSMILSLVDSLQKQYNSLLSAVRILSSNPNRSFQEANNVLSLEEEIDNLYRKTTIAMYRMLREDIIVLMLVRDLVDLLEDSADLMRNVAENLRFLALYRAARK